MSLYIQKAVHQTVLHGRVEQIAQSEADRLRDELATSHAAQQRQQCLLEDCEQQVNSTMQALALCTGFYCRHSFSVSVHNCTPHTSP